MKTGVPEICAGRALLEPRVAATPVSLSGERVAGIEQLRIAAAIGIVWFHTEGASYRTIGYAGLPVFLLVFFSLITLRDSARPAAYFLRRRWNRLLRPWLFWSAVYGFCRLSKALYAANPTELWETLSFQTLLAGTSIHLWYLPYAFVSGLLIFEVNRRTRENSHVVAAAAAATVGILTLTVSAVGMRDLRLPRPLPQWEFGLAAIPLGLAIGRCLSIQSRNLRRALLAGIGLAVLAESTVLGASGSGAMAVPYGIATTLVCIAYCREARSNSVVTALAPLTFGIYLVHPLVLYGLRCCLSSDGHYGLLISLAVCVSALVTLVLMKTPVRRFV